ncbi:MAG: PspA/IM30 family protein [Kiritimatiellia bacterium]
MSLLSRMKRVSTGKLELFLAKSENPEIVFPQLILEMEAQVRAATEAEAKAVAAAKQAEKTVDVSLSKLNKMTAGAEAALKNGDENMAREAVEAQVALEAELIRHEAALQSALASLADARAARMETQQQLQEVRAKKNDILTRARVVQTQEQVQRSLSGPSASSGSILDAVAAMEARIEEREAQLQVRKEGIGSTAASPSLERRIDDMNRHQEIDRRLAALKEKILQKV